MANPDLNTLAEEAREISVGAVSGLGRLPGGVSPSGFIAEYSAVGPWDHYRHVPRTAVATVRRIAEQLGPEAVRSFLRAALGEGIVSLATSNRLEALPPRIVFHHIRQLRRLVDAIARDGDWLDLSQDIFLKECGLVTLRLYAAGFQLVDVRCGIPRSLVWRAGVLGIPGRMMNFLRLGGFKPFAQIHTHVPNLGEFNEESRNECYRCCAALFEFRPDLLGMFGSSWFYDPALAEVSPHLNYLRDVPLAGGADLMFVEQGGGAVRDALETSNRRRRLYEEGKYMPRSYMLIWGRRPLLAWALGNPEGAL